MQQQQQTPHQPSQQQQPQPQQEQHLQLHVNFAEHAEENQDLSQRYEIPLLPKSRASENHQSIVQATAILYQQVNARRTNTTNNWLRTILTNEKKRCFCCFTLFCITTAILLILVWLFFWKKSAPTGTDCLDIHLKYRNLSSGIYALRPPGIEKFSAYCDMDTDGGGWTVFQRRIDNNISFYDKTWIEYKNGFNNGLINNLWLGNNKIHVLSTKDADVELRIDIWGDRAPDASNSNVYLYGKYSSFWIENEANYYTFHISSITTGNASINGQSIYYNNGRNFSTIDVNQDNAVCSGNYEYGGWWFDGCTYSSLNGKYIPTDWNSDVTNGFKWYSGSNYYNPVRSRMMLRKLGI